MAGTMRRNINPQPLDPDDDGIGDFFTTAALKADASRGSRLLRNAILKMHGQRVHSRPKRAYRPYGDWEQRKAKFGQIRRVQQVVAEHFGLPPEVMTGWRGRRDVSQKRQVAMFLAREIVCSSYPDIARCFGGKDHTTVMYACEVVAANLDLADDLEKLREKVLTQ